MAHSTEIQINPVPIGRIVVTQPCTDCEETDLEKAGGLESGSGGALQGDRVSLSAESQEALQKEEEKSDSRGAGRTDAAGQPLTEEELRQIEQLQATDREVRAHEQAHKAAAGPHAAGGPTYEYTTGPDGKRYAVAGEVQIDTAPVPDNPEATIRKAQTIRRAALAPAEPSPQDRAVAAKASQLESQARQELQDQRREENRERTEKSTNEEAGATGVPENAAATPRPAGENPQQRRQISQFTEGTPAPAGQLLNRVA